MSSRLFAQQDSPILQKFFTMDGTPERVCTGLKFPEGPAFDGKSAVLVSNCYGTAITRYTGLDGSARTCDTAYHITTTSLIQKTNGMTYFRDGSLFVCDFGRKAVVKIAPNGTQELYADQYNAAPLLGPNDLAFDPQGHLYFTDPTGSSAEKPIGAVYRVEAATRAVKRVAEGLAFPNGIAFGADGATLFVAESRRFRILKFRVNGDGTLGEKAVFATMPDKHDPDGIALDSKGNLWVAQFGSGAVRVFDASGTLVRSVQMPGKDITNLEFAGQDMKILFITEADTGSLYKLRVDTAGQPLFCSPVR
jgi:gluconolactonase